MVAHTGFLITARRLAPGAKLPQLKRRASKGEYTEADVAAWTPDLVSGNESHTRSEWSEESIGQWSKSDKVLRKKVRAAQQFARERGAGDEK
jgi:tRNA (adenine57-N1/adenine58-N1)-methyltransferase